MLCFMDDRIPTYLGIDLETTGLVPASGCILEVAAVVLDQHLAPRERYHARIDCPSQVLDAMDQVVIDMHVATGLIEKRTGRDRREHLYVVGATQFDVAIAHLFGMIIDATDERRAAKMAELGDTFKPDDARLVLLGNGVHFDRAWLRTHAPSLEARLHHRNADAQSIKTAIPGIDWPKQRDEDKHHATNDIDYAIEIIRVAREICRVGANAIAPSGEMSIGYVGSGSERLDALLEQTRGHVMTDAERDAYHDWMRGEMAIGNDADEARTRATLRRGTEPIEAMRDYDTDHVIDVMGLIAEYENDVPPRSTVEEWNLDQRKAAIEFCLAIHVRASDNDDVAIPPCPEHLRCYVRAHLHNGVPAAVESDAPSDDTADAYHDAIESGSDSTPVSLTDAD